MFATLGKASPDRGNIKGLNLVVVKHNDHSSGKTTVVAGPTNDRASSAVLSLD
jgi:hypothetical protein